MIRGAPYAALSQKRKAAMFEILSPKKGKLFLDLGSGDGRVVSYFSKKGIKSYGIEINPLLYFVSKLKTRNLKNAHIKLGDYWKEDFSRYDYIAVWVFPHTLDRLEKKFLREMRKGSFVVSNHYQFKNWKCKKSKNDIYLYEKN